MTTTTTTNFDRFFGLAPLVQAVPSAAALVERFIAARDALNSIGGIESYVGSERVSAASAAYFAAKNAVNDYLRSVGAEGWKV